MNKESPFDRAQFHARAFLEKLPERPVCATASLEALRERLVEPLGEEGLSEAQVIDDLVAKVEDGLLGSAGGRFFGWVIGGTLPAAAAADWLTTVWDQNAAASACSPATAVVEEVCGAWLKQLLNIPSGASFGFATGCQGAHTTALAAARHALSKACGWNVERCGLSGGPQLRLVTSESRHESLMRSVRLLGLGTDAVTLVECESTGAISLQGLEGELARNPTQPTIVCLQAGDLNTGAFDPFAAAIPLAKSFNAWVHIDGAIGLWVAASPRLDTLTQGAELADSWATDGHKWLNLPFDSGFVFVTDPAAHSAALTQPTSYAIPLDGLRNPMDWNLEWSRRARVYPAYAALRSLGRKGVSDLIERSCDLAKTLVAEIGKLEGVEVLAEPIINQGLVRFICPEGNHDGRTDRVIEAIQSNGRAWFGGTTWRGRRAMRISVCNWRTTGEDVNKAVAAVRAALCQLGGTAAFR